MEIKVIGDKQLIIELNRLSKKMRPELNKGLSQAGEHLKRQVKDKFGEYQRGWPKLKRATVIAKYRRRARLKGNNRSSLNSMTSNITTGPDEPLSLFNKLKESIDKEDGDLETKVYSDNEYSAVHEYGYAPNNIPARSYMRLTLDDESDEVYKIIYNRIGKLL